MQTLTSLAQEHHLTIVYPFPIEVMAPFAERGDGVYKKDTDEYEDVSPPGSSLRLFKSIVSSVMGSSPDLMTPSPEPENGITANPSDDSMISHLC